MSELLVEKQGHALLGFDSAHGVRHELSCIAAESQSAEVTINCSSWSRAGHKKAYIADDISAVTEVERAFQRNRLCGLLYVLTRMSIQKTIWQ